MFLTLRVTHQSLPARALHLAARALVRWLLAEEIFPDDRAAASHRPAAALISIRRGAHEVFLSGFRDAQRVLLVFGDAAGVLLHGVRVEHLQAIDA
jgi:hypothetical protein